MEQTGRGFQVRVVGELGEHEVPAVEAVLAAVGDDVARIPDAVLARLGQEEGAPAAIDARDHEVGFEHSHSLTRCVCVAGEFRGRRIVAPAGTSTRPTTDRVREATFNALGSRDLVVGTQVADLFAGSGAIGIEALSRGAEHCTFVERDRDALRALRTNLDTLGLADRSRIVTGDVLAVAGRRRRRPRLRRPAVRLQRRGTGCSARCARRSSSPSPAPSSSPNPTAGSDRPTVADGFPNGFTVTRSKRYGRTWVTFFER